MLKPTLAGTLLLLVVVSTSVAEENVFFDYQESDEPILEYVEPLGFLATDSDGVERMPLYRLRIYADGRLVRSSVTSADLFAEATEKLSLSEMNQLFSELFAKGLFRLGREEIGRRILDHTGGRMASAPHQDQVRLRVRNVDVIRPGRGNRNAVNLDLGVGGLRHTARLLGDDELHSAADAIQLLRSRFFGLEGDGRR